MKDLKFEITCSRCMFPFDENGDYIGHDNTEDPPPDEETAAKLGWKDFGYGLFCPKCTKLAEEEESNATTGGGDSIESVVDRMVIQSLAPTVSEQNQEQVLRLIAEWRRNFSRKVLGEPVVDLKTVITIKDDTQAEEILDIFEKLEACLQKEDQSE